MTALFDQEEVTKALIASKEASAEKRGIKEGMLQMAIKSWQMFGKNIPGNQTIYSDRIKVKRQTGR